MRLLTVNVAVALASRLTFSEIEEYILDTLNSLCGKSIPSKTHSIFSLNCFN